VIRLFKLQQSELAPTSPLTCWNPLKDFHQYHYNNIAAHLFLIKQSDLQLSFRSNQYLSNTITGGSKALKDVLPLIFLQRYYSILGKYNLIYQEQVIFANGLSLCNWSQFIKRPFASHISTQ